MTPTRRTRTARLAATVVALTVVLSAFGPVGIVSAQSVSISQTAQGDATVAPGETITIEATIDYSDANAPGIDATLPAGWTVTSHTDDGGTYGPPQPAWAWIEGDGDGVSGSHTVTYTVAVPGDAAAGDYTVSADGSAVDPATGSFVSDTDDLAVTVETQQQNAPPTADAGADVTVTAGDTVQLDASGSGDPDGSVASFAWSQTGTGPPVTLSDASAAQPSFTAPSVSSETTLTFEATVTDDDGASSSDAVAVTVEPTAPAPEPSVTTTQTATSPTTVAPGDTVSVEATIDYSDANAPGIDVTLPAGWTVTSHTDDGGTYGPPQPAWAWTEGDADGVSGSHTVTYTVAVPGDASQGTYQLSANGSAVDPTDSSFVSDTDALTVTVEPAPPANQPPSAGFSASPSDPQVGETVDFDAASSSDPDGSIASYEWTIETAGGDDVTLLESDFESGSLSDAGWTQAPTSDTAGAGVSDATAASGSSSAFHQGGSGAIVSGALDASGDDSVEVSYWVRKGDESFSENPDAGAGEDLVVEYLDAGGNWVEIDRVEDSVAPGTEVTETVTLSDAAALHDGLQIRFRQEGGSVAGGDYWHVDDVSVVAQSAGGGTTTQTGDTASHSFAESGTYQVQLVVTDDDGATDTATGTVAVTAAPDPGPGPIDGFPNEPTDPDGDGLYEDVNGDGSVNVGDAQAIFANTGGQVVQNNVAAFDFNGDGSVNVGDAQALFASGEGV